MVFWYSRNIEFLYLLLLLLIVILITQNAMDYMRYYAIWVNIDSLIRFNIFEVKLNN